MFKIPALTKRTYQHSDRGKKKAVNFNLQLLVGKTGFEPATPWSQTRCATGLRYFPIT